MRDYVDVVEIIFSLPTNIISTIFIISNLGLISVHCLLVPIFRFPGLVQASLPVTSLVDINSRKAEFDKR